MKDRKFDTQVQYLKYKVLREVCLLYTSTVAERRENMLWFRTPEKVYFKKGCMPVALDELKTEYNRKKAFIVTDSFLFKSGFTKNITCLLYTSRCV